MTLQSKICLNSELFDDNMHRPAGGCGLTTAGADPPMTWFHFPLRFWMRSAIVLAALAVTTTQSFAHPHVWVTMKAELVYAADGTLTGVRHAWTFDDMFSSYATQGIPSKTKGQFTREELHDLAKTNIESLKDYRYFNFAKVDGKKQSGLFGEPIDYWLDYDGAKPALTLHFTLPLKKPIPTPQFALEVYDPEFFIDFGLADKDAIKLTGAPASCTFTTTKPHDESFAPSARTDNSSEVNAGMGMNFANTIAVQCP